MRQARDLLKRATNSKERKMILKEIKSHLEQTNKKYPLDRFIQVDIESLDNRTSEKNNTTLTAAYRSRDFMAMIFDQDGHTRISVCRTAIDDGGDWIDGITFDQLFWIKNKIGFSHRDAVEIYPTEYNFINEANMRHLFVLKENLPFIWQK